jgi:hypothetical protein
MIKLLITNVFFFAITKYNQCNCKQKPLAALALSLHSCKEDCKEETHKLLIINIIFFAIIFSFYNFFGCA